LADATTTVGALKEAVRRFVAERKWEPYHAPKNLAMALAVEAAELMEPFLWVEAEESRRLADDAGRRDAVADELADVAYCLINLCLSLGIDLSDAFAAKTRKNAEKYPPGWTGFERGARRGRGKRPRR
jgi:NTP pyrophosphatase (non-canonical NTP hydrolase)